MPEAIRHLVVVVPGIGGSVLRRDGRDLWNLSLPVATRALLSSGRWLDELRPDDPALLDDPDHDDGIEAVGLVQSPVSLPGLVRLTGYGALRDELHRRYALDELTYLEFAYDWRRDLRHSAAALADAVASRLAALDAYVGRAEVIVIAHSMGGLVARWWLDHFGGTDRCRGLITLGTPYRGSPKAVRMLAGGYVWRSVGSRRVAELLRCLPSVHQLLPMYRCVYETPGGEPSYVHELQVAPPGIDLQRAAAARQVLLVLNRSEHPALTTVIGGIGQDTLQSISVVDGRLEYPNEPLPPEYGRSRSIDGDATVPWISSRPLDLQQVRGLTPSFAVQTHGGLSREDGLLRAMIARIDHLLMDFDPARAHDEPPPAVLPDDEGVRLTLDISEEYLATEPVSIGVRSSGLPPGCEITVQVGGRSPVTRVALLGDDGAATIDAGLLEPGSHPVVLAPAAPVAGVHGPLRVIDVIDVWAE